MSQVERATDKVAAALGRVNVEQAKYDDLVRSGSASRTQLITQYERLTTAQRRHHSTIRDAVRAHRDLSAATAAAASPIGRMLGTVGQLGGTAAGSAASVARLGGAIGGLATAGSITVVVAAAAEMLFDVGRAAVTATQSLWLLPSALAAAGTGFAALKIGFLGFADAIKEVRDPEKFAEALQSLSPNAQQAALSIRELMPAFDGLKNSVQDSLFAGVAPQIEALTQQYLPTLEAMLSSVAGSFNTMFSDAVGVLQENPDLIGNISTNVQAAFRNLAQAAGPLTEALTRLVSVGSDFLPGLADAAANAATEFANFVAQAAATGDLQRWIQDGITAAKELGGAIWDIGKIIYDTFGSAKPEEFRQSLDSIVSTINFVGNAITGLQTVWNGFATAAEWALNRVIDAANTLLTPLRAAAGILSMLPGVEMPTAIPYVNAPVAGTPVPAAGAAGGIGGAAALGGRAGAGGLAGLAGPTGWSPRPVPAPPPDSSRGSGPRLPDAPVVPYDSTLPPGFEGMAQNAAGFSALSSYLDARHDLAEKQARLEQLERDNNATAEDRLKARNDVIEAEQDLQAAELRLYEARDNAYEQMVKSGNRYAAQLGDIGAQLDQDFGISKGLAGIAENITKFVANLAAAPLLGQLGAISQASPSQGGHGLMGILGAQGAFGPQFTGLAQQQRYGYAASALGPSALRPTAGYLGDAALLANVPAGTYSQTGIADLTRGIGDCSSAVEDLVNLLDGRPTGGRSMSTGNAAEWLTSRGFLPGTGGPGDFRVAFNSGHMQATLPGGTPFNWGSQAAAARRGIGGTGADDPALTQHYYRPVVSPAAAGVMSDSLVYSPANTNPALTNPAAPMAGVSAAPFTPGQYGGVAPASVPGGGGGIGITGDGAIGLAMEAGGAALNGLAPGAGQAAQTGVKLINRGIEFGAQAVGIGVNGAIETLVPFGGSEMAANNWITRIAGAFASAAPALPNLAGDQAGPSAEQVAGADPNATQHGQAAGQQPGPVNITVNNQRATEDGTGRDIAWHMQQANTTPGRG
ncbi:tape measure protein [Mycobacterium phage Purgamenstris]|uniref:Tape measure protein n=5 Tax=Charlievirus redi TaxID=2003505 RepID=A0A481VZH4_9CAUD|nr:tail length tape measure protein [Mycobacterium phage Redi]QAY15998.1 tape measure protein [Mycobacterium phage BabeRuth]QBI99145.1 tape measure protein [Mycobacterium phage Nenae]QBI99216.1 tape measure protein [Mycobacterium phage Purgamenstris]QBI99895.1 tape measure protein [Mycobacterium phage ShrimpFriedEgg]AEN79917.1 tape measure protein [Mycobacterium phage Redi]